MKLKIRYENMYQFVEVDADEMWVNLSLDYGDEALTREEKEALIQKDFDERFNKPEYNCWHKFDRHWGNLSKPYRRDDEDLDDSDGMDTVADYSDEEARDRLYDYDAVCQWIRETLGAKREWADMFIAIRIDGRTIRDYAKSVSCSENGISQKLRRIEKKLKEAYSKHKI